MTFFYNNVYLEETSTVCGPYEAKGPLKKYFDKKYTDMYFGQDSFEHAEINSVKEAINLLLLKSGYKKNEIDIVIGGDLLNQITASTYGSIGIGKSFIGIYGACSSSVLGLIIGANFIEGKTINNALCVVSSHNMTSEKQFRNPTEYGSLRPKTATFTATGVGCALLTNEISKVRIECATLGKIIDYEQNDPNDMGRVMAPAAIDTLVKHFEDTKRSPKDYDLIITGDLGYYGKNIVIDYMKEEYGIDLDSNYNDCGLMLYDIKRQKDVKAGGSGPACSALVTYSYIFDELKKKNLKKVLLLATGALFSPQMLFQKENIYSICHAVSLEVI